MWWRSDPRCEPWAYVTDGSALFEVQQVVESKPTMMPPRLVKVIVEDCQNGERVEVEPDDFGGRFRLVRAAPAAPAAA